ncbi:MAG: NADH-quinone oxidoreductase subunit J [Cyanobacteria bacterium]|nr:NADH-quinone oxidoreductase subunit J [Cyanobacteriota bacterium]
MVIFARHIIHSALYLALTLLCVATYFILLKAEYLAVVQIMVYIGAVVVMILFALMLTRTYVGEATNISNKQVGIAAAVSVLLLWALGIIIYITRNGFTWINTDNIPVLSVKDLGAILFSKYVLPFEIISLLILGSLIGSVVLAMKEKNGNYDKKDGNK